MRDDILDRVVQPLVNHFDIPVEKTAKSFAYAYAALTIVSAGWAFDYRQTSYIGTLVHIMITFYVLRGLLTGANMGAVVLGSPLGVIHMLMRVAMLGLGILALSQFIMAAAMGTMIHNRYVIAALGSDISLLCLAMSLFIAVCDQPPRKKKRPLVLSGRPPA